MKILVCDDHAVVRDGLRLALGALGPEVELIDADGLGSGLDRAREHADLDLVLLDLQMPGVDGLDGLRRFRTEHPSLPVVVVSGREEALVMREALDLGASGFIPKSAGSDELRAAVQLVLSGGAYVPRGALAGSPDDARARARRERTSGLTERQLEVLSLLARGLTNREISGVLGIAENTVKTHVKAILEALDATNRTEAAVLARELDLKAPGEA